MIQSGGAARLSASAFALLLLISAQALAQKPSYEARLKELKIELPPPAKPMASYVTAVRTGNLVFLAGAGPMLAGKPTITGKVGADLTEEQANKAARETILVSLAALRAEIGSLDKVKRIVKLTGWVNSAPGFTRQPWVINGASDLLVEIFGDAGKHARSSIGAYELPWSIPVEIEMIVEVEPEKKVGVKPEKRSPKREPVQKILSDGSPRIFLDDDETAKKFVESKVSAADCRG